MLLGSGSFFGAASLACQHLDISVLSLTDTEARSLLYQNEVGFATQDRQARHKHQKVRSKVSTFVNVTEQMVSQIIQKRKII